MTNTEIAKLLRNVAASYTVQNESKYRFQIMAYQKASEAIENTTSQIKDLMKENKLDNIPGIGSTIKQHIEELIKTGKVKHFQEVMKDIPPAMFPLLDVPTFGPKKAYKLVSYFRLKNPATVIEDIEQKAKVGEIASIEGFGEKSQADILRAIEEFRLGKRKTNRMVLPFAAELADKVIDYLKKSKYILNAYPLGSLRRLAPTIGDIDIAISTNNPQKAIEHFVQYPYKERMIEKGDVSASLLISGGKQVDLIALPPRQLGSLLQHFTGSKNHNVHLRELAIKRGASLSERGIKWKMDNRQWKIREYDTEEKFYKALGLDWIPPEIREDKGEIEKALHHNLPRLVNEDDIKGDIHIHSNYPIEPSHDLGKDSMEHMVQKALNLGYEYLGFSEHNPSISNHSKAQIYTILEKRQEYIATLKEQYKKIKILNLLELDILANGQLALDDKALEFVDTAIVSIHSAFSSDRKTMTKRALSGLSHPKAKVLCHPTGRLLNVRPGYDLDFDEVFDFCKKHNKALEINSWPTRLDLPDIMVFEAVQNGVHMVINTDSHAKEHMDLMKFGVAVARRGWAERKNILNTKNSEDFIKWINE